MEYQNRRYPLNIVEFNLDYYSCVSRLNYTNSWLKEPMLLARAPANLDYVLVLVDSRFHDNQKESSNPKTIPAVNPRTDKLTDNETANMNKVRIVPMKEPIINPSEEYSIHHVTLKILKKLSV